jgi:hypothetical protein
MASLPGLSKLCGEPRLVFKLIPRPAHAGALRVSALDHEIRNHAMENCSIVEVVCALLSRARMHPLALTLGKISEVGDGFGRVFLKQAAHDVSFGRSKHRISAGLAWHK